MNVSRGNAWTQALTPGSATWRLTYYRGYPQDPDKYPKLNIFKVGHSPPEVEIFKSIHTPRVLPMLKIFKIGHAQFENF